MKSMYGQVVSFWAGYGDLLGLSDHDVDWFEILYLTAMMRMWQPQSYTCKECSIR